LAIKAFQHILRVNYEHYTQSLLGEAIISVCLGIKLQALTKHISEDKGSGLQ